MQLNQIKQFKREYVGPLVALEIECESQFEALPQPRSIYWICERDGSLRGESMEYIFGRPILPSLVGKALKDLNGCLQDIRVDFSHRTSVHTHINVQDLTVKQIYTMVYIYYLLEEAFMEYAGAERRGNVFCLRVRDSGLIVRRLLMLFSKEEGLLETICNDADAQQAFAADNRYSALNVAPLAHFGSLEFRALRGTQDADIIEPWVEAIVSLRENAVKWGSPKRVSAYINRYGLEMFFKRVFQKNSEKFFYEGWGDDIMYNQSLTAPLLEEEVM